MEKSVPLSSLAPSARNARRTHKLVDIDVLAAQIKSQGLLQKLIVRETGDDHYEVVDGARRLAALKTLVRSGDRAKTDPVPVLVLSDGHDDTEVSLVANTRVDMHPADTFEAFRRLAEKEGASPEAIGLRFGYATATVKGFLKLANVSPKLMRAFRKDELNLDQMKALAITDDHKRQETAFFGAPDYLRDSADLRRSIMQGRIEADDKFARFVGIDAYQKAGGAVTRDLFGSEDQVYLEDATLLNQLASEKLAQEADALRQKGWKWVEVHADLTSADLYRVNKVSAATHGFAPDSKTARLYAGIILGLERDGTLKTIPGVLRPDDAKALKRARAAEGKATGASSEDKKAEPAAIPAAVIEELTAIRTMALRAEIIKRPELALAILVHDLALASFYEPWENDGKFSGIASRIADAAAHISKRDTDKAVLEVEATDKSWAEKLPEKVGDLWPWLQQQDQAVLLELLACLVATAVDAILYRHEKRIASRVMASHRLAQAVDLDMTAYWIADTGFLARLPKSIILGIIAEAVSPDEARSLDRGSKADVVAAGERKLAGTDWLPRILRKPDKNIDDSMHEDESGRSTGTAPASADFVIDDELESGDD